MVEKKWEAVQLLVRIVAVVFGVIVLALIEGKLRRDVVSVSVCFFQKDGTVKSETCDFGTAMGAVSLVLGLVLSVVNILALVLPAPLALVVLPGGRRGKLALVDLGISILLAVVWIACGIFSAVKYAEYTDVSGSDEHIATLVFEFLSFLAWIGAGVMAIVIYKTSDTILPGDN